jgi:hypothetical protein
VNDIVERLRRGWHRKDASGRVAHEAADEIERLRGLINGIDRDAFINADGTDDGCLYDRHGQRVWLDGGLLVQVDPALLAAATPQEDDRA